MVQNSLRVMHCTQKKGPIFLLKSLFFDANNLNCRIANDLCAKNRLDLDLGPRDKTGETNGSERSYRFLRDSIRIKINSNRWH